MSVPVAEKQVGQSRREKRACVEGLEVLLDPFDHARRADHSDGPVERSEVVVVLVGALFDEAEAVGELLPEGAERGLVGKDHQVRLRVQDSDRVEDGGHDERADRMGRS